MIKKILILLVFSILFIGLPNFSANAQEQTTQVQSIATIGIYIFDPYASISLTSERYAIGNLQDYLYLNKIKSYYLGKLTYGAAIQVAKEKGVSYVLEVKGSLLETVNSIDGYGATYFVESAFFSIKEQKALFSGSNKSTVEGTLSETIAQAYAFSNAAKTSVEQFLQQMVNLLSGNK